MWLPHHGEVDVEVGHVSQDAVDYGDQLRVVILKHSVGSHVLDDITQQRVHLPLLRGQRSVD